MLPRILGEEILHNHWRKLINRRVQLPTTTQQQIVNFELVSQGDHGGTVCDQAVLVFVWNQSTQTAVLIREYMPSVHAFQLGLVAGMVEQKHGVAPSTNDPEAAAAVAARDELEEEARLVGGTWIGLCAPTVVDKYMTTRVTAYLVLNPEPVANLDEAKPRDATEEGGMLHVVPNVTVSQLKRGLVQGHFTSLAGWAIQLALSKLQELGLVMVEDDEK